MMDYSKLAYLKSDDALKRISGLENETNSFSSLKLSRSFDSDIAIGATFSDLRFFSNLACNITMMVRLRMTHETPAAPKVTVFNNGAAIFRESTRFGAGEQDYFAIVFTTVARLSNNELSIRIEGGSGYAGRLGICDIVIWGNGIRLYTEESTLCACESNGTVIAAQIEDEEIRYWQTAQDTNFDFTQKGSTLCAAKSFGIAPSYEGGFMFAYADAANNLWMRPLYGEPVLAAAFSEVPLSSVCVVSLRNEFNGYAVAYIKDGKPYYRKVSADCRSVSAEKAVIGLPEERYSAITAVIGEEPAFIFTAAESLYYKCNAVEVVQESSLPHVGIQFTVRGGVTS